MRLTSMDRVTDAQIDLLVACSDSPVLSEWIHSLATVSPELREKTISDLVEKMRDASEEPSLIDALEALKSSQFFRAFYRAWNEHGN